MAITEGSIGTPSPEGTGKKLRTLQQTTSEGTVHLEGVAVCQPDDPNSFPLGALTDAETVNSQIGLLKRIVSRLIGNLASLATWQAVPTSATDLIASTVTVLKMHFTNTTAAAITVTVNDKSGSPLGILTSFSIPANSFLTIPFDGVTFTGGIRWIAGGAGLNAAVVAYQ